MSAIAPAQRVAILIDGDNVPLKLTPHIIEFLKSRAKQVICQAIGDWKQAPLVNWRSKLKDLPIELIQRDRVEKNATDYWLMMEAAKLLGTKKVDIFVIVSNDGDFAKLYDFIHKEGKKVVCIGSKNHISKSLIKRCDLYLDIEQLTSGINSLEKLNLVNRNVSTDSNELSEVKLLMDTIFSQLPSDNEELSLTTLGQKLRQLNPQFDSNLKIKKLSSLIKRLATSFELKGQQVRKIKR